MLTGYLCSILLKSWSTEYHWFCPKRRDDDSLNYDDPGASDTEEEEEHVTSEQKAKLIEESYRRTQIAYRLCMVYGLSEEEAADWQERHRKRSNELLTTCDRCVRNWHMGRKAFLKEVSW